MVGQKKNDYPYNPKARLVMRLEEVAAMAEATQESIDDPKIRLKLEKMSERLWKAVKQKSKKLTKEELSFVEAERIIENIIYAKDCLENSLFPQKYLPAKFVKAILELGKSSLKFRPKFSMPPEDYKKLLAFNKKLKRRG